VLLLIFTGTPSRDLLAVLDRLFRAFLSQWRLNAEAQRKKAEAEAELFKFNARANLDVRTEEQMDEAALAHAYPDYTDMYQDILDDDKVPSTDSSGDQEPKPVTATATASIEPYKLDDALMNEIYSVFSNVFETPSKPQYDLDAKRSSVMTMAYSATNDLLETLNLADVKSLPHSADAVLLAAHMFTVCSTYRALEPRLSKYAKLTASFRLEERDQYKARLTHIEHTEDDSEEFAKPANSTTKSRIDMPDVYREPNTPELKLLEQPLAEFMVSVQELAVSLLAESISRLSQVRLRTLLNEFAHHPVLVQLVRLTHRISALPVSSPIMKVLAGIELLLQKAEKWEKSAPRSMSIAEALAPLARLVARWRKLELHSWPKALQSRDEAHRQKALSWWFHLYGLVHASAAEALSVLETSESLGVSQSEQWLRSLYGALEEFIQRCTLGELHVRLGMLEAFRRQLAVELACGFDTHRMPNEFRLRLLHVLSNVCSYYRQFLPDVHIFVDNLKKPIEVCVCVIFELEDRYVN